MSCSIGLLLLARSLSSTTRIRHHRPRALTCLTGLILALTSCENERTVAVRVSMPDAESVETPAAGVGIVALPYDRDSVLASLEARAPTRRPHTAALDSLFRRFRGPFTSYTRISYALSRLRDSLGPLRTELDTLSTASPRYRALATQVKQLSDSLQRLERGAERARLALDGARSEFLSQSESLRAAVRHWEDSTYRGYDSIVGNLAKSSGREATTDTTGETGWAHLTLGPGRWWIYARAWDTSDPNAEWYWNIPVDDDTLLLSSRTAERRPRY